MASTGKSAIPRRAAAGLLIAAGLLLGGCSGADGAVDFHSFEVTERDIEVARQLDAPERVMESLERGEWLYVSDRDFVRYAELAIDHMREARGQECRATWVDIPWVLRHEATAHLVVVGGEHDGAEVSVTISMSEPRTYADDWVGVERAGEFDAVAVAATAKGLSDLPEGTWLTRTIPMTDETTEDALAGQVRIYISPGAVSTQEELDRVCESLAAAYEETRQRVVFYVFVVENEPPDGVLTDEFLAEAGGVLLRGDGNVGFDAE